MLQGGATHRTALPTWRPHGAKEGGFLDALGLTGERPLGPHSSTHSTWHFWPNSRGSRKLGDAWPPLPLSSHSEGNPLLLPPHVAPCPGQARFHMHGFSAESVGSEPWCCPDPLHTGSPLNNGLLEDLVRCLENPKTSCWVGEGTDFREGQPYPSPRGHRRP